MRSQQQIENIKNGVLKTKTKKMENMEYIGVLIPYGYTKLNNILVPNKETSHIVYLIFDLYDKGCSNTQIANYLNDRYIISPSAFKQSGEYIQIYNKDNNKLWERGTIRKILQNKIYNGYYKYSNKKTHEPIIDDELFIKVQNRISMKRNSSGNDFYYHNGNIFSNKACCACCGKPFTLENSRTKDGIVRYLRCGSYDTRKKHKIICDNKLAIRYEELKDIVNMFIDDEIFSNVDKELLTTIYSEYLKGNDIVNHRKYLKQEKNLLITKIEKIGKINNQNNNLISKITQENNQKLLDVYKKRLEEIETMLKELYSFARTKEIASNELFTDKFIIDTFVDKILIGKVEQNNRKIEINLV